MIGTVLNMLSSAQREHMVPIYDSSSCCNDVMHCVDVIIGIALSAFLVQSSVAIQWMLTN